MKFYLLLSFLFTTMVALCQSHSLTVVNGYGSGQYQTGDTIDIWSEAFYNQSYFDRWQGDSSLMNDPLDWHTRLVMPVHDVTVEARINPVQNEAIYFNTEIEGIDTLKKVWFAFPGLGSLKGMIWLFHGTNGSGENWFLGNDMLLCINKFLSEGYGVVSLDCEEKTYDQDFNGDDVYRWNYSIDSLKNIDLRNVKAIRDTMIDRGWMDGTTPQIAYGYSAGGAFASHIANLLKWYAAVSHNSSGLLWIPDFGTVPVLYSMTEQDDHPEVGAAAAIEAQNNSARLLSRGVCSQYHLALQQPLYPERFHRDPDISIPLSIAIFNELNSNSVLDAAHFLIYKSEQLITQVAMHPANWPVLLSLTGPQRVFVGDEIDETYTTHRFNSDLFGSDLRFIKTLCTQTSAITPLPIEPLYVYPNPARQYLVVPNQDHTSFIFGMDGKVCMKSNDEKININQLSAGSYVILCGNKLGRFTKI